MQAVFAMLRIVGLLILAALLCAVFAFIMLAAMIGGMLHAALDTAKEWVEVIDAMVTDFRRWIVDDIEMIRAMWIGERSGLGPDRSSKAEGLSTRSPSAEHHSRSGDDSDHARHAKGEEGDAKVNQPEQMNRGGSITTGRPSFAIVAQPEEQPPCKRQVAGSIPADGSTDAWLSTVERPLWEREVAGSNPAAPTNINSGAFVG